MKDPLLQWFYKGGKQIYDKGGDREAMYIHPWQLFYLIIIITAVQLSIIHLFTALWEINSKEIQCDHSTYSNKLDWYCEQNMDKSNIQAGIPQVSAHG